MKLNANSNLFKYAFLLSDRKRDIERTSLCGLFWRCVLTTAVITIPSSLFIIYLSNLIFNFSNTIGPTLCFLFAIGLIVLACYVDDRLKQRKLAIEWARYDPDYTPPAPGLVETAFYAVKNKVCPFITVVRN
jgi:hypothetical protein